MSWSSDLRALEAAATPGPWRQPIEDEPRLISGSDGAESLLGLSVDDEAIVWSKEDAFLIVAVRNQLLTLLDALDETERDFKRLAYLGNLARSRTTEEQDELSALIKKAQS